MNINQIQDEIIEEFSIYDDWMDKYALLIEMGNALPQMSDADKTPEHIIEGCQSRVWIKAEMQDGQMSLVGDSDAVIVRGIVALLLKVLNGQTPQTILESELYFIKEIGLQEHLSPTRSNGLVSMLKQIRLFAATLAQR